MIVVAVAVGVSKIELIVLLISIAFVLVAEMINTAIEGSHRRGDDVLRSDGEAGEGHRRRRCADRVRERHRGRLPRLRRQGRRQDRGVLDQLRDAPAKITLVALVLDGDHRHRHEGLDGSRDAAPWRPSSGHAAVAFAGWMAATYILSDSHRFVVSALTFIMALLVAQTRVESGVHSALEVAYGGASARS